MKILDRYIFKQFLATFFFVVLVINSIICVIDYGEKTDDFMSSGASWQSVLFDYYANFVLHITNMLSPITIFIATVFITARLAARTEIVAILASGVSFSRILVPYFWASFLLAVITFGLTTYFIPKANKTRVAFENSLKGKYRYDKNNVHFKIAPNLFAYFYAYDNSLRTGYQFTLEKILDNTLVEKLSSNNIVWDTVKNVWHIDQYKINRFKGERETVERGSNMDTVLSITPKDFESTHLLWETLTLPELEAYIKLQFSRGNTNMGIFLVDKNERFAYPFTMIILTIMGVIISARKSRQGVGWQIAFGFLIAFTFIIMVRLSRSLGQAGSIDPMLAAWSPTLIFTLITAIMYKTVPR